MGKRVFLIVLDSVGVGEAPDAELFDDVGCDTLAPAFAAENFMCPIWRSLVSAVWKGRLFRKRFPGWKGVTPECGKIPWAKTLPWATGRSPD